MELQKSLNNWSNPKDKEQCWRYPNTWAQIILQNHNSPPPKSRQGMVLYIFIPNTQNAEAGKSFWVGG